MNKLLFIAFVFLSWNTEAQRYMTKTGSIVFNAAGAIEKIEGKNQSVACVLDASTGTLNMLVQVKSFVFEKQLMQEHFNENYMESDQFPKASFKGEVSNKANINFSKDGDYPAEVKGKLTIHGVTKDITAKGKIQIRNGNPTLQSNFTVLMSDYNINIPGAVKDKISKDARITVDCSLTPFKS
ncbi:MAG TPA: YceI family protein [Chitinophagaceae bacterium]|nr:YceI family protein [Chitinophagaceae bacterium]HNF72009.1 YceI family protein [Chitinophagaceae bacterium]